MKHYIIVKFIPGFDYTKHISDITDIFNQTLTIPGITEVNVKPSNSERANRYDLMIKITMSADALAAYDVSAPHRLWKEKYGEYIDKKAIFDCD